LRRVLIVVLALTLVQGEAMAWHDKGHRATAWFAYDRMGPAQREEVIGILRAHPRFAEDFAAHMPDDVAAGTADEQGRWLLGQAATWPDLIQLLGDDVKKQYHHGRWHYINLPVWLTEADRLAMEGKLDHNMDTRFEPPLRPNLNVVQALRGNLQVWRDPGAADADKAVALCWILHLTGDLHQPLHTVALFSQKWFPTGDRGGNEITVQWGDKTRNLHAVWDGLPTDMDDLSPSPRTLRSINEDVVDDAAIDEWLHHHARLAERFVYNDEVLGQLHKGLDEARPPTITLSHNYLVAARSLARRQINLASYRIQQLLLQPQPH